MRFVTMIAVLALAAPLSAEHPLNCRRHSLADAVAKAGDKSQASVITFTGVCAGPIAVGGHVTLQGVGEAIIDGGGQDAVLVAAGSRASLSDLEVRHGLTGIIAFNGAHLSLTNVDVYENAAVGIALHTGATAVLTDVETRDNGLHGIDVHTGSSVTATGFLTATGNRVFGINVNGSAITFSNAAVTASGNALGIQISTNGSAFINDRQTVANATGNLATGLTVVSGAQLVSFGGTINASNNPVAGVTVDSKAGLDLDAASTLNTENNGDGLRVQQESVITVFNTPQFSGVPGFSTINARNNTGSGVRVLTGSTLTLVNQARVISTQNGAIGVAADNGAGLTLVNSALTGNTVRDLQLTFGTRADLQTLTFDTVTCDGTVILRGSSGITCPQ